MNPVCKICGSYCTEIKYHDIKSFYYKCSSCDFIFLDTTCCVTTKQEQAIYSNHNNFIGDPVYEAYFVKFIEKCLLKYTFKSKQALDFGSGPEPVLANLLRRDYGFDVTIYDKYYAPEKIYRGNQYDLITVTEVIEHLEDPLAYFHLFKSLLKPNGILAMMTQFHPNDDRDFKHWHYRRDESHISFFTPKTMAVVAELIGLEIVLIDNHKNIVFKK